MIPRRFTLENLVNLYTHTLFLLAQVKKGDGARVLAVHHKRAPFFHGVKFDFDESTDACRNRLPQSSMIITS